MLYLVSYDLTKGKDEDYKDLIDALKKDGGIKILFSEWLVRSNGTAKAVADKYLAHMDADDRLFVCGIEGAAWIRLMNEKAATQMLNG